MKYIWNILKFAFAVGIIYWLVQKGHLNFAVVKVLAQPEVGLVAAALVLGNLILASERWRVILKAQDIGKSFFSTLKMTFIGLFFNYAMPGGVGGDIVKAYYAVKDHPEQRMSVLSTIFMDRVFGLYSMVAMAFLVMVYDLERVRSISSLWLIFIAMSAIFAFTTVGLGLSLSRRIRNLGVLQKFLLKLPQGDRLNRLYLTTNQYGRDIKLVLQAMIYSALAQTLSITFLIVIGKALGFTEVPLSIFFIAAPIGFIVTAIPISPAGVGVGQSAFFFLFNVYMGQETELGPSVLTLLQIVMFVYGLIGAVFYIGKSAPSQKQIESFEAN